MSISLSDLATTGQHILQSTAREDHADEETTVTTIYQILLLTYKTREEPSLADVLHGHHSYFSKHDGAGGGGDSVGLDETCYQYILDLALSSERDWWSKLELATSSLSSRNSGNNQSKKRNRGSRARDRKQSNAPDYDSYVTDDTFSDEDSPPPPLLSWAAHCWLDTSFGTSQPPLPEQLVSYEDKEQLAQFASQYPGLSRMRLQGRDDQVQPHWWTGKTTTGLSLYLSAATSLHRWWLRRMFLVWFRAAARSQRQRYRNSLLLRVMERRSLCESFSNWSEVSELTRVVNLREVYFLLRRSCRRWKVWISERELRRPFAGWVRETIRWRRKLVAFEYWSGLSFLRQLGSGFKKLVVFHGHRENELRLGSQRYYFDWWRDVAYWTWESRAYFRCVGDNAIRVRRFQTLAATFNCWNSHVYRVVHCYREGAKRLELVGRMNGRKRLASAMETWYHAYMMNLHTDAHRDHLETHGRQWVVQVGIGGIGGGREKEEEVEKRRRRRYLEKIHAQSLHLIRARLLGRCFQQWVEITVVEKNDRMCQEVASRHLIERMMGQAFFKWESLAEERKRVKDVLLKKYFFRLMMNLIHARQEKIKWLEATIFYQKNLVDQCFLTWRLARLNRQCN